MKLEKEEFKEILCKSTQEKGISLNEEKLEKLYRYKELLLEWNEKINLTAITDDFEIIIKHFLDCLECSKAIGNEKSIIDIGTGAGFPGMVLAIFYPDKEFTLLDALNKRLVFLEEVINKLDIKNVKVVHARAEEVAREEQYFEKYDMSVSRAVASLPVLLEYVSPFIKVNGKCLVMKGDNIEEELSLANNAFKVLKLKNIDTIRYSYNVNNEEYNRCILKINKYSSTPDKYPRNYGQIKKKPL